jgi:hypothetical protein
MHELLHVIGLCPDSFSHINIASLVVANQQFISDIQIKTIKDYVTKCKSGFRPAKDKR